MAENLEKVVKRYKADSQYKNLDENAIISLAEHEIKRQIEEDNSFEDLDIGSLFTKKEEVKLAKELVRKYLMDYQIEAESDKNLLKQLIYLEVIHTLHLQRNVNEAKDSEKGTINSFVLDSLHKNINQIVSLKEKLGLTKDSKKEGEDSVYSILERLKRKFKIWQEENQGSRQFVCPHCGKLALLKIKMDKWDSIKHPFFKDRILANKELIKLYKEGLAFQETLKQHTNHRLTTKGDGKLWCADCSCLVEAPIVTKQRFGSVLDVSSDYADWVISKIKYDDY